MVKVWMPLLKEMTQQGNTGCFSHLNARDSLAMLLQCKFVFSRSGLEPQVLHLELTQKE